MSRPAVDVVIPFAGTAGELKALIERLAPVAAALAEPGDTLTVADNRPPAAPEIAGNGRAAVLRAPGRRSSYHARNAAAGTHAAPWLLFIDADVDWEPALLDAYFDPPPNAQTAILGGGVIDEQLAQDATAAERYSVRNSTMASATTLEREHGLPYAQTANCMVRRAAFEQCGGFVDDIRSGGDADLSFRLQAAGWQLEQRPEARVVHRNRRTVAALLKQKARHGAGARWLEQAHPGSFPPRRKPGLALWSARKLAQGHNGDALLDITAVWAFELGRALPNRGRVTEHR
jgi:GT2 family glycosyltransferase